MLLTAECGDCAAQTGGQQSVESVCCTDWRSAECGDCVLHRLAVSRVWRLCAAQTGGHQGVEIVCYKDWRSAECGDCSLHRLAVIGV